MNQRDGPTNQWNRQDQSNRYGDFAIVQDDDDDDADADNDDDNDDDDDNDNDNGDDKYDD